jgi:hypothetical protein
MGVGGVDWVSEKVTGGEGLLSAKASDYIIKSGDILGNEGKWNTHWMERGINTTMAAWTGTEREADKKQWTEEQENTAKALEDAGVVDLGLGQGDIEDLKELTLLDPKSLEALLAYQVWSDKDQKLIEDLKFAKEQGVAVNYVPEDVGSKWNPFDNVAESLSYGEVGSAESPTVQSVNVSGSGIETPLSNVSGSDTETPFYLRDLRPGEGDEYTKRDHAIAAISKEMSVIENDPFMAYDSQALEEYDALAKQLKLVSGMTSDEFDNLTPDAGIMDRFYLAGTTKGSIYVHDINVEKAINSALGIELGKAEAIESDLQSINAPGIELGKVEAIESGWLDKLKVTAGEWAEKASQNSGQAPSMVNAPTTIDQSSKQSVNVGSSAHAPAQPLGSGYMGVSTPRG